MSVATSKRERLILRRSSRSSSLSAFSARIVSRLSELLISSRSVLSEWPLFMISFPWLYGRSQTLQLFHRCKKRVEIYCRVGIRRDQGSVGFDHGIKDVTELVHRHDLDVEGTSIAGCRAELSCGDIFSNLRIISDFLKD